jgi:hypothetical protein
VNRDELMSIPTRLQYLVILVLSYPALRPSSGVSLNLPQSSCWLAHKGHLPYYTVNERTLIVYVRSNDDKRN